MIENLFCQLTGKEVTMKLKLALRAILLIVFVIVHQLFGTDAFFIVAAVMTVADLDSIANSLSKKGKCD